MPGTWEERPERAFMPTLNKSFRMHFDSATALQLQCGYSIASRGCRTIKSEMLTTQLDMNCKGESSPTERRLLDCIAYVKSPSLARW